MVICNHIIKREDGKGDEEGETRRTKIRRSNVN